MTTRQKLRLTALFISGAFIVYGFPMIIFLLVLSIPAIIKWRFRSSYGLLLVVIVFLLGGVKVIQSFL